MSKFTDDMNAKDDTTDGRRVEENFNGALVLEAIGEIEGDGRVAGICQPLIITAAYDAVERYASDAIRAECWTAAIDDAIDTMCLTLRNQALYDLTAPDAKNDLV